MSISFYDLWRTPVLSGLHHLPPQSGMGQVSYAYPLTEEQEIRIAELFARNRFCWSEISKKTFSLSELCTFIEEQLKEKRIAFTGSPLVCGMVANHILTRICYSTIEICYIIAENQPNAFRIISDFMRSFQEASLEQNVLIFRFGHIKIRFFTPKNYGLAPDGFYISLSQENPKAHYKKGEFWVENFEFEEALKKLQSRQFNEIPDYWNLILFTTHGFYVDAGVREAAIKQIKQEPNIAQNFYNHQNNHYPLSDSGKIVDFWNQLSLLKDDRQLIEKLSLAWIERGFQIFEFDALKTFVNLIKQDPNRIKPLLVIYQAIFLIAWMHDPESYQVRENIQLFIGVPNIFNDHYFLAIENSPLQIVKEFVDSWNALGCSLNLTELLNDLNLSHIKLNSKEEVIDYFSQSFMKPPLCFILNKDQQIPLQEYLQQQLAGTPFLERILHFQILRIWEIRNLLHSQDNIEPLDEIFPSLLKDSLHLSSITSLEILMGIATIAIQKSLLSSSAKICVELIFTAIKKLPTHTPESILALHKLLKVARTIAADQTIQEMRALILQQALKHPQDANLLYISLQNFEKDPKIFQHIIAYVQEAIKTNEGYALRTSYELVLKVLEKKKFPPTLLETLAYTLIDLPSTKCETDQTRQLYLDIGLDLLVRISPTEDAQRHLLTNLFKQIHSKNFEFYLNYVNALERVTPNWKNFTTILKSLLQKDRSEALHIFISKLNGVDPKSAFSFATNRLLKNRMSTEYYSLLFRDILNEKPQNASLEILQKRFQMWQEMISQPQPIVEFIKLSLNILKEMSDYPKDLEIEIKDVISFLLKNLPNCSSEENYPLSIPLATLIWALDSVGQSKFSYLLSMCATKYNLIQSKDNEDAFKIALETVKSPSVYFMTCFLEISHTEDQSWNLIKKCVNGKSSDTFRICILILEKLLKIGIHWNKENLGLLAQLIEYRPQLKPDNYNEIRIQFLRALIVSQQDWQLDDYKRILKAIVDSNQLWTCPELENVLLDFNKLQKNSAAFEKYNIDYVFEFASRNSDPAIFNFIKKNCRYHESISNPEKGVINIAKFFQHTMNICESITNKKDTIPYVSFLKSLWSSAVILIPLKKNESHVKTIHDVFLDVCLKSGNEDFIGEACVSFLYEQSNPNEKLILSIFRKAIRIIDKKDIPETNTIEILTRLQEKKENFQKAACAGLARFVHLQSKTPSFLKFERVLAKALTTMLDKCPEVYFVNFCKLLFERFDKKKFQSLFTALIKSYYSMITHNSAHATVQAEYFRVLRLFLDAGLYQIDPVNILKYLLHLFETASTVECNFYREMGSILSLSSFSTIETDPKNLSKCLQLKNYYCRAQSRYLEINLKELTDQIEGLFNFIKDKLPIEMPCLFSTLEGTEKSILLRLFLNHKTTQWGDLQYFVKLLEKVITFSKNNEFGTQMVNLSIKHLTYLNRMYSGVAVYAKQSSLINLPKQTIFKMLHANPNKAYVDICTQLCGNDFQSYLPLQAALQILAQFQSDEQFQQFLDEMTKLILENLIKPLATIIDTNASQQTNLQTLKDAIFTLN